MAYIQGRLDMGKDFNAAQYSNEMVSFAAGGAALGGKNSSGSAQTFLIHNVGRDTVSSRVFSSYPTNRC